MRLKKRFHISSFKNWSVMMAGAFSLAVAGCSDQAPSEADDTQIENTDEGTVQKLPDLTAGVFNLDDMIAQNPPPGSDA